PIGSANWTVIGSHSYTQEDFYPALLAWSHDVSFADQQVRVAFDNFLVTSGRLITAANLTGFTLAKSKIQGSRTVAGTVTLSAPALSGGLTVHLRSADPAVHLPASVTVP